MSRALLLPGDTTHFVKTATGLPNLSNLRIEMKVRNLTPSSGSGTLIRLESGAVAINIGNDLAHFLWSSAKSSESGVGDFITTSGTEWLIRFQFDSSVPRYSLEMWQLDGNGRIVVVTTTGVTTGPLVTEAFVSIGNAYAGAPTPIGACSVDWARIYNTTVALNSTPPTDAIPSPGAALVANWEFEDSLNDSSGNAHHMVWQGTGSPSYENTPGSGGGTATQLVVTTQPGNASSGVAQVPQPVVEFRDASNVLVTSETSVVTAALILTAGSGTAVGTPTKSATGGVANFAGNGLGVATTGGVSAKWRLTSGALTVDTAVFTITGSGAGNDITDLATALGDPGDGSVLPVIWSRRYGVTNNGSGRATSIADARASALGFPLVGQGTLPVINADGSISTDGATNGLASAASSLLDISSGCTFFYIGSGPPVGGLWPIRLSSTDESRALSIRDVFDGHYAGDFAGAGEIPYHGVGMPAIDSSIHLHLMRVSDFPAGMFSVNAPIHSYELAGRLKRINFQSGYQGAGANKVLVGQSEGGTYHAVARFYAAGFIRGTITRAQENALRVWAQTYEAAVYFADKNGLIMLGDSLTYGLYSSSDPTTTAPLAYVMSQTAPYNMGANYDALNLGFSSRQAFNAVTLAPSNLHPEIGTYRVRDVVVVWLGTNDIAVHGRTAAQVAADLHTIVTGIKAQGGKVAVCTLIPRGDSSMDATKVGYFTTLNATIRSDAVSVWGADLVIDLASIPEFNNFSLVSGVGSWSNSTYYSDVQVHLTALGGQVIATSSPNGIYPRLVSSGILLGGGVVTFVWTRQPGDVISGGLLSSQPRVERRVNGATVPGDTTPVTMTLVTNSGGPGQIRRGAGALGNSIAAPCVDGVCDPGDVGMVLTANGNFSLDAM